MNTQELARLVAADEKVMPALVLRLIEAMAADVEGVVAGGGLVCWPKFGTFYARYKGPRVYHTPQPRKRAARAGEGADKFFSLSLPKWVFVFSPARHLKSAVGGGSSVVLSAKPYDGVGSEFNRRMASALELSSVEVAGFIKALVYRMTKTLAEGQEVRFCTMGVFGNDRRAARYIEVQKAGGGRHKVLCRARTVVKFRRYPPGSVGP